MTTVEDLKALKSRAIDITYKHKLSHLSSVLNAIPVLYDIYKNDQDVLCILSSGHAGLAQYVILEYFKGIDAEYLLDKHGIHPCRDPENFIECSTGSLGSGLPISVGYAIARPNKTIHCIITDGECGEGSIWESLRFIHVKNLNNLKVHAILNGQTAYEYTSNEYLSNRLRSFLPDIDIIISNSYITSEINGLLSHYRVMTENDYTTIKSLINQGDL